MFFKYFLYFLAEFSSAAWKSMIMCINVLMNMVDLICFVKGTC